VTCDSTKASCSCRHEAGHDGDHECSECEGAWNDNQEVFVRHAKPKWPPILGIETVPGWKWDRLTRQWVSGQDVRVAR
jgi:hypothetical protein